MAHLATGVILQAVKDLRDNNILKSLDALIWWITDGPTWVNSVIDSELDDIDIFKSVIMNTEKTKITGMAYKKQ